MNLFWYHNLDKILDKQKHFLLTFVRVFQKVFEVINAVGYFVAFSHKKKLLFDLCNISLRLQFFSSMGPWLNMCYAQYISIYEFSFYTLFYEQMKWKEKKNVVCGWVFSSFVPFHCYKNATIMKDFSWISISIFIGKYLPKNCTHLSGNVFSWFVNLRREGWCFVSFWTISILWNNKHMGQASIYSTLSRYF